MNYSSMTSPLGLLAVAGHQNRDKLAELLGKINATDPGAPGQPSAGHTISTTERTRPWLF